MRPRPVYSVAALPPPSVGGLRCRIRGLGHSRPHRVVAAAVARPPQEGLPPLVLGPLARHLGLVQAPRCQVLRAGQEFVRVLHVMEFLGDSGDFSLGQSGRELVWVQLQHGGAVRLFYFWLAGGGGQVQHGEWRQGRVASLVEERRHGCFLLCLCKGSEFGRIGRVPTFSLSYFYLFIYLLA
jgi:hypothetical protein